MVSSKSNMENVFDYEIFFITRNFIFLSNKGEHEMNFVRTILLQRYYSGWQLFRKIKN